MSESPTVYIPCASDNQLQTDLAVRRCGGLVELIAPPKAHLIPEDARRLSAALLKSAAQADSGGFAPQTLPNTNPANGTPKTMLYVRKCHPAALLPTRTHPDDAGLDLYACLEAERLIPVREWALIDTGISLEIPKGNGGFVWSRSGLAVQHGITTGAGVIDAGYTGSIKVHLFNFGLQPFVVQPGMRIAQIVISPVLIAPIVVVDELPSTSRGNAGFGSSGA